MDLHLHFEPSLIWLPNGMRYLRVGGTRQRRFIGTSLQLRKLPKNAVTPTRRVHAVLGGRKHILLPLGFQLIKAEDNGPDSYKTVNEPCQETEGKDILHLK